MNSPVDSRPVAGLWPLARRLAWQEGRHGILRGFVLALALAIACVLCVSLVADRLQQALGLGSREFLAADLVLQSSREVPASQLQALPPAIEMSRTLSFSSMLFVGDVMQLASVKAVSSGYPFYGQLQLSPAGAVKPGEIWLSPRLMALLQARSGDELELGAITLKVAGQLLQEPDESFSPFLLAPRAMIHLEDVARAQVILPGSRLQYRYLFRGQWQAVADWQVRLQPTLTIDQRLLQPGKNTQLSGGALQRSERFFRLASLMGLLLGAMAMQIAMSHFTRRQADHLALLKTLGASRHQLWFWMLGLLGLLTGVAFVLGGVLGYLLHLGFLQLLGSLLPPEMPPPSWQPFVLGAVVSLLITLLLSFVPFWRLLATPPQRVLRQQLHGDVPGWLALPLITGGTLLLGWWFTGDARLSLGLLLGMALLLLMLGILAYGLLWVLPEGRAGTGLALALRHLRRERWKSLSQLAAIALALLLIGVLWASRAAILAGFDQQLRGDLPNRFALNIADADKAGLQLWLQQRQIAHSSFYPVIRGRLTQINGQAVAQEEGDAGRAGVNRELSMTWLAQSPTHNQLVAGQWWHPDERGLVSVELGVAERLGIELGDTLQFSIEGRLIAARVGSLRRVNWQEMQPNFFMIFSPDLLQDFPASWLVSLRLPASQPRLEVELVRQYPALTLIDTDSIMQRLQEVLEQISRALGLMFSLVALAAVLVLFTQVQAGIALRWQELVLMRTLGAGQTLLRRALRWELVATGALAGCAAALCCEGVMWLLMQLWSELAWQPHYLLWLVLPLLGVGLVLLAAYGPMQRLLGAVLARRLRQS
ncbi:MAG: FtsX-like permease family protein [Aeromonadaceae bacterium]|nr:FtsX-like permease family protein [Aeromonadaceae bacterium]